MENNHNNKWISSPSEVHAIILAMTNDQREHTFSSMTDVYLKYRKPVVEWMLDVCGFFKLHVTTAHAAVSYLDRLQPTDKFSRHEWQMIAIACILIASKYNECEEDVPPLATLEEIIQHSIQNETMLNYELWALKRMSWLMNARTPMAFLSAYSAVDMIFIGDILPGGMTHTSLSDVFVTESIRLATLCLIDTKYKQFLATDVAGALMYLLREVFCVQPVWREELTELTFCQATSQSVQDLIDIMRNSLPFDTSLTNSAINGDLTQCLSSSEISCENSGINNSSPTCTNNLSTPQRPISNDMNSPVSTNLFMRTMNLRDSNPGKLDTSENAAGKENLTSAAASTLEAVSGDLLVPKTGKKRTSPVSVTGIGQIDDTNLTDLALSVVSRSNVAMMR